MREYRNGATIVAQFLPERWKPLKRLCQSLAEFSAEFLLVFLPKLAIILGVQKRDA